MRQAETRIRIVGSSYHKWNRSQAVSSRASRVERHVLHRSPFHALRVSLRSLSRLSRLDIPLAVTQGAHTSSAMATPSSSGTSPSPALSFTLPTSVSENSTEDPNDVEQAEREERRKKLLARTEFAKVSTAFSAHSVQFLSHGSTSRM